MIKQPNANANTSGKITPDQEHKAEPHNHAQTTQQKEKQEK